MTKSMNGRTVHLFSFFGAMKGGFMQRIRLKTHRALLFYKRTTLRDEVAKMRYSEFGFTTTGALFFRLLRNESVLGLCGAEQQIALHVHYFSGLVAQASRLPVAISGSAGVSFRPRRTLFWPWCICFSNEAAVNLTLIGSSCALFFSFLETSGESTGCFVNTAASDP